MNRRICGLAAVTCLALTAGACGGEGGEEAVFLYFINGYPGTGKMTVNGTSGSLAQNVPFGERYGEEGTCGPDASCVPVRVERQLGQDWTVLLENMPQQADLTRELFSMYPHETGTLVMTRRSGEDSVEATLLRHTQSISSQCALTVVNGLSLDNTYLTPAATFSFAREIFLDDRLEIAAYAGFSEQETETPFISECGALPTDDPTHDNLQRPEVIARVLADPWFFEDCSVQEDEGACRLRWGIRRDGDLSLLGINGNYLSPLDSREYALCIQSALSIRQPEDAVQPAFPGVEPDCPTGELTWADVDVDFQAVQECQRPVSRNTLMIEPGSSDVTHTLVSELVCDMTFRLRAGGQDVVFGPKDGEALGSHGDGAPVSSDIVVPAGSQRFYVVLGRPVNPIIWQWDSSETFVDLSSYPYFNQEGADNGNRPDIGDTDRP